MKVEWWQTMVKGKNNKDLYRRMDFDDIKYNWDETVKFKNIKVTFGRGHVVEFVMYNSLPYLSYLQRMNKNERIKLIEDKFAFTLVRTKLGPSATEVLFSIEKFAAASKTKVSLRFEEVWFDEATMEENLNRLDEIMGYLLEYEVADILMEY